MCWTTISGRGRLNAEINLAEGHQDNKRQAKQEEDQQERVEPVLCPDLLFKKCNLLFVFMKGLSDLSFLSYLFFQVSALKTYLKTQRCDPRFSVFIFLDQAFSFHFTSHLIKPVHVIVINTEILIKIHRPVGIQIEVREYFIDKFFFCHREISTINSCS